MKNRMHVVSFVNLNEESDPLKDAKDVFKVRFFETGTFSYKCSIYTRMKGTIEVIDPPRPAKKVGKPIIKELSQMRGF